MPLTQQHELEHGQWSVRFGASAVALLPTVQAFELAGHSFPVDELVQFPCRRVFNKGLGAHQKEALQCHVLLLKIRHLLDNSLHTNTIRTFTSYATVFNCQRAK
jgi:hypothetical protein